MSKWTLGALGLAGMIFVVVVLINYWPLFMILIPPHRTEKFQHWETKNSQFQICVEAFHECCGFLPGGYYTFSSSPVGSDKWQEIMTFRHDDPIPIRTNQFQVVSDDVAFIFMGWMFASTNDAGKSWAVWDACKEAPTLKICNYEGIRRVELAPTGLGTMTVNPIPDRDPLPILLTDDFGNKWHN